MTKKDYEAFANEIYTRDIAGKNQFAELCADVFAKDNQLFQRDKFFRACFEGKHIRAAIKQN